LYYSTLLYLGRTRMYLYSLVNPKLVGGRAQYPFFLHVYTIDSSRAGS